MPNAALELVGIQAVLTVMGVGSSSANTFLKDLPLFIAFGVLAVFTYVSGLRAPALIAFIKDILVYLMIIVAVVFGTIAAYKVATPTTSHWAGSVDTEFGHIVYIGLSALILNIAITLILTLIFNATRVPAGADETLPRQYTADPVQAPAPTPAGVGLGTAGAVGDLFTERSMVHRPGTMRATGW